MKIYALYTRPDLTQRREGIARECVTICFEDDPLFDDERYGTNFACQYEKEEIDTDTAERIAKENPLLKERFENLFAQQANK